MVVRTAAAEDCQAPVAAGHSRETSADIHFGHCLRQVEFSFENKFGRYIRIQIIQGRGSYLPEHLPDVLFGMREISKCHNTAATISENRRMRCIPMPS